jgi:E3 ubiquitin-protein ligase mind-bomb
MFLYLGINYVAKICDMGISRLKAIQTMDQSSISGIPGTPSYTAPECLLKNEKATVHSDIWSLACTLLEMYTERMGDGRKRQSLRNVVKSMQSA